METIIYVKLLNEGTLVYRPVSSIKIDNNVYEIGGHETYSPDDEIWEFIPGTIVVVQEHNIEDETVLIAIKEINDDLNSKR